VIRLLISASISFGLSFANGYAQENIPVGEWRIHVSYNSIRSLTDGGDVLYAAAKNGIMILDKADQSFETLTRHNALKKTDIVTVAYDHPTKQLLVAYSDGSFDVVKESETRNFDPSLITVLTGPKSIHHVSIHGLNAYFSTDYGVLVFDLVRSDIKETWRDLGEMGSTLAINGTTFKGDSIFLATDNGVISGNLNDNLLDFTRWKRFTNGVMANAVTAIATFNSAVFAAIDGQGLAVYNGNGTWSLKEYLAGEDFYALRSTNQSLLVAHTNGVSVISSDDSKVDVVSNRLNVPADVLTDNMGVLWIADSRNGLLKKQGEDFISILPNGPATDETFDLFYHEGRMYLTPGGFDRNGQPFNQPGIVSYFENGTWSSFTEEIHDISSLSVTDDGKTYLASFGNGLLEKTQNASVLFNESNSTLSDIDPGDNGVNVSAVVSSEDGIWVTNYGASESLHLLSNGSWQGYSFPQLASRYPVRLLTDYENNVWMLLNPREGGGVLVFNPQTGEHNYLIEDDGSGELPSRYAYSLAEDRDGYIWVGTDAGVAYFFDEGSDAVKPIFENRFLLRDDKVTAIAVDGGNRKWMGTERGVWLINPTGDATVANFTMKNSPLLSDTIRDIELNPVTGEVFFSTSDGLVSFRSDATESSVRFGDIKIFPNPVLSSFTGLVGITGLATDAIVKITDVSGRLIFETAANGGMASWNVRDHSGRRVPTGVFLVFAVTPDGSESIVGKIAVVN
jgi:hypothetical protein